MRIHIVKRDSCPWWKALGYILLAVLIALVAGGLVLFAMGVNPFAYYYRMFTLGMVGSKIAYRNFENYLKIFVPLCLTSVALSLAFRMRFWNIGGEGQFIMGAIAASTVAFKLGPVLPQPVALLLMCLAAMLAGGIYGTIASALKVRFGTNETLLTLMLNYIALYFLTFLAETKAKWNFYLDPTSARPIFVSFSKTVSIPGIHIGKFTLNICVILTILLGVLVSLYLNWTKQGYEIAVVGDSPGTAKYAGMKVSAVTLRTVFLSAALVGLAGAFKTGTAGILSTSITDDVGFTGIIVAWLAHLNTGIIFIVAALISMLQYGSMAAASTFASVDSSFADMLQGALLFLVLAADFFTRFRIAVVRKGGSSNGNG